MHGYHVLKSQQFDRAFLERLFPIADEMRHIVQSGGSNRLAGYMIALLFYEPSTRTRFSFEAAIKWQGGQAISSENAAEFSSAAKGETIEDTTIVMGGYANAIVMRHKEAGAAERAAKISSVPIINAGDGPGQHPTQALLDIYTIKRELGGIDGRTITFVGDLANGRTVRSLAYLLTRFAGIRLIFVSPDVVRMKDDIKAHLDEHGVPFEETHDLLSAVAESDVVYVTRIQKERFGDRSADYEAAKGKFIFDTTALSALRSNAIIMHPLPRVDEITTDVDADPRAAYFRQAENGLYVRMALLWDILGSK